MSHKKCTQRVLTKRPAYARVKTSFEKNKKIQKATTNNTLTIRPWYTSTNFLTEKSVTPPSLIHAWNDLYLLLQFLPCYRATHGKGNAPFWSIHCLSVNSLLLVSININIEETNIVMASPMLRQKYLQSLLSKYLCVVRSVPLHVK